MKLDARYFTIRVPINRIGRLKVISESFRSDESQLNQDPIESRNIVPLGQQQVIPIIALKCAGRYPQNTLVQVNKKIDARKGCSNETTAATRHSHDVFAHSKRSVL